MLRVLAGLAFSLAFLVVASEGFFTRAASRELIQQTVRAYAADGGAVEHAYQEGDDLEDAIDDALDLVDSMEDRFGVISAKLLDSDRKVVVAPRDANLEGSNRGNPPARNTEPDVKDVEVREIGQGFEFVVPIHLGGKDFFLQVREDGEVLHGRIGVVSTEAMIFSIGSLLVAIALFYVIGGRTLARRHSLVTRRAMRDPLTDLGNHRSFQEELARAVAVASREQEPLALALVDLDKFKAVNDRHGHRQGDEVLREVARVLGDGRGGDRAFRIGGDEFALILPGVDAGEAFAAVERRLAAARVNTTSTSFTAGVAMLPGGPDADPAVLWEQADAALYEGKRSGGGDVVAFDDVSDALSIITPDMTKALRALLEEPRLEIAFQPIWDLHDAQMLGFEALARPWNGYGFEGPLEMFAVAERVGRAHDLDGVCRAAALARAGELPDGALLFLNVSPQSLVHGSLGGDSLLREVTAAGLQPAQIVLEITERSAARLSQVALEATRLHDLGFRIALDDVGAGNAGLDMLRALPVDFVKIDNSVIAAAMEESHAQAVLLAIVAYARRVGAYVIAEGIETQQMLAFAGGIDELHSPDTPAIRGGQGYLLGHPSPDLAQPPAPWTLEIASRSPNGRGPGRSTAARHRLGQVRAM
ncbi:MAG TPA: EAL domain-containing protein [Gaiellaceae bacterium]|nr:EAL domain-containing protein [Gaiellaceae bacterium]